MVQEGTVKWYHEGKGFGFIEQYRGEDVFVHHSSIVGEGDKTLHAGDRVTFDFDEDAKRLQAKNVVKIP